MGAQCDASQFVTVAAGAFHSCGLRANGAVTCWGLNTLGQASVPAGLVATDITAGLYYTCALQASGGVKCWGDAVGAGMPMDNVANKPDGGSYLQLFGGDTWACAQDSTGLVNCFGANFAFASRANTRALGIANSSNYAVVNMPGTLQASGITGTPPTNGTVGYAVVDCGEMYCCAIRETRTTTADRLQGAVQCWGNNTPVATGQTAGRVLNAPALTTPTAFINAGVNTACAIQSTPLNSLTDLQLTCWGSNTDGVATGRPSGQFVAVAVGNFHACAVAVTGGIRCWGYNLNGQAPAFVP
jgi:hypothetical protein